MDTMSIQVMLVGAVPECILSIMIGLLLVGEKNNLFKPVKLILTVLLMTVLIYFTRKYFLGGISFMLNFIGCIFIIYFVYRIKLIKSILCVSFFTFVIFMCEMLYAAPVLKILGCSSEDLYRNALFRFQFSLPTRFIQIIIIVIIWNLNIVLFDIQKYRKLRNLFILILTSMFFVEAIFTFTYLRNINKMPMLDIVLYSISCVIFITINILLVKFILSYSEVLKSKHEKELKELNNSIYVYKYKLNKKNNMG